MKELLSWCLLQKTSELAICRYMRLKVATEFQSFNSCHRPLPRVFVRFDSGTGFFSPLVELADASSATGLFLGFPKFAQKLLVVLSRRFLGLLLLS
jgi:hypothetical protein